LRERDAARGTRSESWFGFLPFDGLAMSGRETKVALIAAMWLAVGALACSSGETVTAPSNTSGGQSSGGGTTGGTSTGVQLTDDLGGRALFPSDN
jgi:hypothetical protein